MTPHGISKQIYLTSMKLSRCNFLLKIVHFSLYLVSQGLLYVCEFPLVGWIKYLILSCVLFQCPCVVRKPSYFRGIEALAALSLCPHLPCFSVHRRLSIPRSALLFERPAPMAVRAPTTTTTITAVLPKNKRESVRHHPLDLFHTRAPTSVPDGVAFFQGFSQPQESSKMESPSPWSPLLSCSSSTCSVATRPWPEHVPSLSQPTRESH